MSRAVAALWVVGAIMLGATVTAAADDGNWWGGEDHHRAPEPLTALALAGGAGIAAVAKLASRRKTRRQ